MHGFKGRFKGFDEPLIQLPSMGQIAPRGTALHQAAKGSRHAGELVGFHRHRKAPQPVGKGDQEFETIS